MVTRTQANSLGGQPFLETQPLLTAHLDNVVVLLLCQHHDLWDVQNSARLCASVGIKRPHSMPFKTEGISKCWVPPCFLRGAIVRPHGLQLSVQVIRPHDKRRRHVRHTFLQWRARTSIWSRKGMLCSGSHCQLHVCLFVELAG